MLKKISFRSPGFFYALIAAFLFGASTPASKVLLSKTDPWLLAGLLYFGSGVGLLICFLLRSFIQEKTKQESPLSKKDVPWLLGSTFFGGFLAPVLLMQGLFRMPASSSSLLLNLEGVLTALTAWFVFKEHFDRRIMWGMGFILAGGVLLSWTPHPTFVNILGPFLIAGACLGWAIDNNFTRKISASDPLQIAMIKSLVAGASNLLLAFSLGAILPKLIIIGVASFVGFFSYGFSLLCFILALRHIGTSRTGALFSTAPFAGMILSILFLGEPISGKLLLAGLLMGVGVWLHLTEKHSHEHLHEAMEHEHLHTHDEHHQHPHSPKDPPGEPHTHWHRHEALKHTHPHYPDIHHRHSH